MPTDIRSLAATAGLSLRQLAIKNNIPLRTVENWAEGKSSPPAYVLELLQFKVEKENNMNNKKYELIWSSFGKKNMSDIPAIGADWIVLVINAHSPTVIIIKPLTDTDSAVRQVLAEITQGCNYSYDIVHIIGNTYMCN